MTEFGTYIKKVRESKNMTLNQVALYAEISAAQLSRIETGKRGTPKPQTIEKIAQALKVDYNDLMRVAGYINNEERLSPPVQKDELDIAKRMQQLRDDLMNAEGLAFDGEPISDEARESLLEAMEFGVRLAKKANKKYIPKKYRDTEE